MEPINLLKNVIILLIFAMLLVALGISASTTVKRMVGLYQLQAWLLALIVLLTAVEAFFNLTLATVAILPIFLALAIRPLLGRATLAGPKQTESDHPPASPDYRTRLSALWALRQTAREADLTWLQHGRSWRSPVVSIGIDLSLTVVAFVVAYRLVKTGGESTIDANSLAVSLALLLVGVFIMSNKQDIIAQIMGLLVMEHGLFLAAVRSFVIPTLPLVFAVSLFFYVIITLTILIGLLPALHQVSGSIELDEQRQLRG